MIAIDPFLNDLYAWTTAVREQATALRGQARELCSTCVEQRLIRNAESRRPEVHSVEARTIPVVSNGDALRERAREVRFRSAVLRDASARARTGQASEVRASDAGVDALTGGIRRPVGRP